MITVYVSLPGGGTPQTYAAPGIPRVGDRVVPEGGGTYVVEAVEWQSVPGGALVVVVFVGLAP